MTSSPSGPGEVAHPLHAAAVPPVDPLLFGGGTAGGKFDDRGNYFNEDLLLARAQGSKAKGLGPLEGGSGGSGQGARGGGDNLMDSAGDFFSTARLVTLVLVFARRFVLVPTPSLHNFYI